MEYELNSTKTIDWIFSSSSSDEISSAGTSFNFSNAYSTTTAAGNTTTESTTFITTASSPKETTTRYFPTYPTFETQPSEDFSDDTILITLAALATLAILMCLCYCGIKYPYRKKGFHLRTRTEVPAPGVISVGNNVRTPQHSQLSPAAGFANSSGSVSFNDHQLPTYDVLMTPSSTRNIQPTAPQMFLIDDGDYQSMSLSTHITDTPSITLGDRQCLTPSNVITSTTVVTDINPFTLAPPPTYEEAVNSQPNSRRNSLVP